MWILIALGVVTVVVVILDGAGSGIIHRWLHKNGKE